MPQRRILHPLIVTLPLMVTLVVCLTGQAALAFDPNPDSTSATEAGADPFGRGNPNLELHVASYWGGPVTGVDIHGDLAYIANGRALRILDISDETMPVQVGALYFEDANVEDVKVRGTHAFLARGSSTNSNNIGLTVVDISDSAVPVVIQHFPLPPGTFVASSRASVHLHGGYVYVSHGRTGAGTFTFVYDATDPANVQARGCIALSGFCVSSNVSTIHDGKLYMGSGSPTSQQLRVFDLDGPGSPPLISTLTLNPNGILHTDGMVAHGSRLYTTLYNSQTPGLVTVDISDPANPAVLSSTALNEIDYVNHRITAADGRLYVTEQDAEPSSIGMIRTNLRGLLVFDIATDPDTPALISTQRPYGTQIYGALAAGDDRVYLWDAVYGLVIVDVSDPAVPQRLGHYYSPSELTGAVKSGGYLYVADQWGGFTVLDVSDPYNPRVGAVYRHQRYPVGVGEGVGYGDGLKIDGERAFLALGALGLEVVDIADPLAPGLLGVYRFAPENSRPCSKLSDLAVQGERLAATVDLPSGPSDELCNLRRGILSLDIATDDPVDIGLTTPLGLLGRLALGPDGYAVAGARRTETRPGAINRPEIHLGDAVGSSPFILASIDPKGVADVALDTEGRLYVTRLSESGGLPPEGAGLYIRDVSNPLNPILLNHLGLVNPPSGCGGSFTESSTNPAYATAVDVQHGRAYVGGNSSRAGRLLMLDVTDPAQPVCLDRTETNIGVGQVGGGIHAAEPQVFLTGAHGLTVVNILDASVPPTIQVIPSGLDIQLAQGSGTHQISIAVRNDGGQPLAWQIAGGDGVCDGPIDIGWLTLVPMAGSSQPQQQSAITAFLATSSLAPGSYAATLCIDSNDPVQPRLPLPVTLTVIPSSDPIFADGFEGDAP